MIREKCENEQKFLWCGVSKYFHAASYTFRIFDGREINLNSFFAFLRRSTEDKETFLWQNEESSKNWLVWIISQNNFNLHFSFIYDGSRKLLTSHISYFYNLIKHINRTNDTILSLGFSFFLA